MKLTLFGKSLLFGLAALLVAWGLVNAYKTATEVLKIWNQRMLVGERAIDLWFTPDGHLAAVTQVNPGFLKVRTWELSGKADPRSTTSFSIADLASVQIGAEAGVPAYAVSPDASLFAWASSGQLSIGDLRSKDRISNVASCTLRKNVEVAYLKFINTDEIVVVFKDGKLEVWSSRERKRGIAGTWLEGGAWPMWTGGGLLALASFATEDLATIAYKGKDEIQVKIVPRAPIKNGLALAIARLDRLAAGTTDGQVLFIDPTIGAEAKFTQVGKSNVRVVEFYNDKVLLAAGDLGGIFSIEDYAAQMKMELAAPIQSMAVAQNNLAFSTPSAIGTAEIGYRSQLNADQQFAISMIAAVVLAVIPAIPRIVERIRQRTRK